MRLQYAVTPEIKALGISSIVVAEVSGVAIREQDAELEKIKAEAAESVQNLSEQYLASQPVLQSYRDLVASVGRSAKKFPPSAESLIQAIQRNHRLPNINTAVDAYNSVACKTFLAFGVHDMDKLRGAISFRLSEGNEEFVSVGGTNVKRTQKGDYLYADENQVLAWLDSKDSDRVKLSLETKNFVMVLQGTPYTTAEYRVEAAEKACQLITRFCGGMYEIKVIT